MGCVVFPGDIPSAIEDGIVGRGFPIEVFNVLGAGDAFMGGFLRGWLRGEPHATSATWANACGAFAVSRLLCSPEYPTWTELQTFLEKGSPHRALRRDEALNHIHWATTRRAAAGNAFRARHRPSRAAGEDRRRGRRAAREDRRLQAARGEGRGAGRRRAAGLRHAARRHLRPRGAVRRGKASAVDRPAGRGAGLAPAPLRGRRRHRLAAHRMAGDAHGEVPRLLSSRRRCRR